MRVFSKATAVFRASFMAVCLMVLAMASLSGAAFAQSAKIQVNDTSITENEISQRIGLLRLERRGNSNAARRTLAQNQLIEEALQFQEARRLQITFSSSGVDQAYADLAKGLKINSGRLTQILNASGIQSKTLKDRLHATALWREVVQLSIRNKISISEKEIIDALGEDVKKEVITFDYLLKEVMFFLPKGTSQASQTAKARAYKKSYAGCDTAVELSLAYNSAGVRTLGRRHSTQFPDALAKELADTPIGGITAPRVTGKGVQMLAVCAKNEARDITFVSNEIRNDLGNKKLQDAAAAALVEMRDSATIVYR